MTESNSSGETDSAAYGNINTKRSLGGQGLASSEAIRDGFVSYVCAIANIERYLLRAGNKLTISRRDSGASSHPVLEDASIAEPQTTMKTQPVSPTLLIKQELIPVEVDNIPSGKRFSPIIIDDSEGTASDVEVDAQMDEDELEPSQPNNGGQDSSDELEYLDNVEPRRIVSVSSPEENGDMEVEEPSKEPEEGSPKALSKELSREVSEEPAEHAVDEIAGGVEAQEEETGEKQVNEEGEGEKENDDKEDDEKEDDEEEDEMMDEEPAEGAPEPAQPEASEEPTKVSSAQVSRESTREPTQAPRNETSPSKEPEETTTQDDEKRDATPKKTTRSPSVPHPTLSPSVPPLPHSASSSSPEPEPTGDLARYIHLFRPTPKPKSMEPAASQPPPSTSKRPFSALEPAQSQPPRPRAAPKRKEFLRYVPATQPAMSATAPARASAASTPTAASLDRAKTISDGSDDDGDATRHKKRAKRSKSRSPAVARGSLHVAQAPGKAHRRPSKHAEHWHTDGSVIIQLQDIAFRLHRSRLAQQSKFFAELFRGTKEVVESDQDDLQVSAWREGQMDSQPLYVVKGVSPEDFAILLNALDNAMYAISLVLSSSGC